MTAAQYYETPRGSSEDEMSAEEVRSRAGEISSRLDAIELILQDIDEIDRPPTSAQQVAQEYLRLRKQYLSHELDELQRELATLEASPGV